ncbi:MAG: nitroreductase family protein [Bacillota bacterium]
MSFITVDESKCKRDGICIAECPMKSIEFTEKGAFPTAAALSGDCIDCGHCVAVCPQGALAHRSLTPEQCLPLLKDAASFDQLETFLNSRRSIRAFKDQPVDRETLTKLINIAHRAPSGHNLQPGNWIVVDNRAEIKQISEMVIDAMRPVVAHAPDVARTWHFDSLVDAWEKGEDRISRGAPHLVVVTGNEISPTDCHIAMTYLDLAAHAMGLGSLWLGYLTFCGRQPNVKEFLGIPDGQEMMAAALIGYPKYRYHRIPARRKPEISWR